MYYFEKEIGLLQPREKSKNCLGNRFAGVLGKRGHFLAGFWRWFSPRYVSRAVYAQGGLPLQNDGDNNARGENQMKRTEALGAP